MERPEEAFKTNNNGKAVKMLFEVEVQKVEVNCVHLDSRSTLDIIDIDIDIIIKDGLNRPGTLYYSVFYSVFYRKRYKTTKPRMAFAFRLANLACGVSK